MFKTLFWILFIILLSPQGALASYSEFDPEFDSPNKADPPIMDENYRWLFELLIPEDIRNRKPRSAKRSFIAHLKDSQKYFPHPNKIVENWLSPELPYKATGKITYVGFFPARYRYEVKFEKNEVLTIIVRIHFKTNNNKHWKIMENKLKEAENQWNNSRQNFDFRYRFYFFAEKDKSKAHFSVLLQEPYTRGPYFLKWSTSWSPTSIAHELGHMMGLGDEYRTISGKRDCIQTSIMCSSSQGAITRQHHYHILRRALTGWNI